MNTKDRILHFSSLVYSNELDTFIFQKELEELDIYILETCALFANGREPSSEYDFEKTISVDPYLHLAVLIRFPSLLKYVEHEFNVNSTASRRIRVVFYLLRKMHALDNEIFHKILPFILSIRTVFGEFCSFSSNIKSVYELESYYNDIFPNNYLKTLDKINKSLALEARFFSNNGDFVDISSKSFFCQKSFLLYSLDFFQSSGFRESLVKKFWLKNKKNRLDRQLWEHLKDSVFNFISPVNNGNYDAISHGYSTLKMPKIDFLSFHPSDLDSLPIQIKKAWDEFLTLCEFKRNKPLEQLFAFSFYWDRVLSELFSSTLYNYDEVESRIFLNSLVNKIKEIDYNIYQMICIQSPASIFPLAKFQIALSYTPYISNSFSYAEREYFSNIVDFINTNLCQNDSFSINDLQLLSNIITMPIVSFNKVQGEELRKSYRAPLLSNKLKNRIGGIGVESIIYGLVSDLVIEQRGLNGFDGAWGKCLLYFIDLSKPDFFESLNKHSFA